MQPLKQELKDVFLRLYDLENKDFEEMSLYMEKNCIPFILSPYKHVFYKEKEVEKYLKKTRRNK